MSPPHIYPPLFHIGKNKWFNVPKHIFGMITVTILVTSTLQSMKQWNLFFFFLMVFTERASVNSLSTLFRMGGGGKWEAGSFLQHVLTLGFNPFSTQLYNFRVIHSTSFKLLNLNQDQLSKKSVFLVKSLYQLCNNNFSHKNAKLTKIWTCDHVYHITWATW